MANVPSLVVPTQNPRQDVPDNYSRVQPTALAGLDRLGQGMVAAGDFFDGAAADDAFNQFQTNATKLLYGDPEKMVPGPGGDMVPDTGYFGLKGRAALDGRPGVESAIEDAYKRTRAGLRTPDQRNRFDSFASRYRNSASEKVGNYADSQTSDWYTTVNKASEENALNAISTDPLNAETVANGASDLINARVKQAQLSGAQPGDEAWNAAIASGKQDALKAQVLAISVADPARARDILEKNKAIAGDQYYVLSETIRGRANQADSIAAGTKALLATAAPPKPAPATGVYQDVTSAMPGGFSASGLGRTIQIESGGDPNAENGDHIGLGQFSAKTWEAYGAGGDRKNAADSIAATQRYAAANAKYLRGRLGRPPTDAELYLAHQQGAGGATKLLLNPDANAASLVGKAAIVGNGGTEDMTAAQFTAMWAAKFDGSTPAAIAETPPEAPPEGAAANENAPVVAAPPPMPAPGAPEGVAPPEMPDVPAGSAPPEASTPESRKAAAFKLIMDDQSLSPEVKDGALNYISKQIAAEQLAEEADAAGKKRANDEAANGYVTRMMNGDIANLDDQIANDPKLEWQTKLSLQRALLEHANQSVSAATAAYGPGFWTAYNQVLAKPDDPSRLSDVKALLSRAGPGGDLTLSGVQYLSSVMDRVRKNPDAASVETAKAGLIAYAKSKLSYSYDDGYTKLRDPTGEAIFSSRFIPQFLAEYSAWVDAGKNPWEFLTKENVDKMAGQLRNPREMAMARLLAQTGVDVQTLGAPPAPQGVDENAWGLIYNTPPNYKDKPLSKEQWAKTLQVLWDGRNDEATRRSFDTRFGDQSITAAGTLLLMTPPNAEGTPEAAPAVPGAPPAGAPAPDSAPVPAPPAAEAAPTAVDRIKELQSQEAGRTIDQQVDDYRKKLEAEGVPPATITQRALLYRRSLTEGGSESGNAPAAPESVVPPVPTPRPSGQNETTPEAVPGVTGPAALIPPALIQTEKGFAEDQMPPGYSEWKKGLSEDELGIYRKSGEDDGTPLEKTLQEIYFITHPGAGQEGAVVPRTPDGTPIARASYGEVVGDDQEEDGVPLSERTLAGYKNKVFAAPGTLDATGFVIENQAGKTRSLPISPTLRTTLTTAAQQNGVQVVVFSGGQESNAEGVGVGSTRHNHGNAADVYLYKDGRLLDFNKPADLPFIERFLESAIAAGATGIGAGKDYMGTGIHIGYGPNGAKGGPLIVWGAKGKSANAPAWLVSLARRTANRGVRA